MNDELLEIAYRGDIAEKFLVSETGKALMSRADMEIVQALADLEQCDPFDPQKIMRLQNNVVAARNTKNWLAEIIIEGRQAKEQLEDEL